MESLVTILSELVSQAGMAADDCDVLCGICLVVLESESDAVECYLPPLWVLSMLEEDT